MKWKGNSGMYFLTAFGSWDSLSVKGTFKPSLLWNNDYINVKHAGTGAMIGLPSKIAISTFACRAEAEKNPASQLCGIYHMHS